MNFPSPTRRVLLGAGLASAAVVASCGAAPALAAAGVSEAALEQQWNLRCSLYRQLEADTEPLENAEHYDDHYWQPIDRIEVALLNGDVQNLRTAELQLWVAWSHVQPSNARGPAGLVSALVDVGDFAALSAMRGDLDWHEKMLLAAIATLRRQQVQA